MAVLAADPIGKVLNDRYEILALDREELLGNVYVGQDRQAGHRVAVKILHPHLTEDTGKFKRFAREITNTWMINQPNTVEVLDWGQDGAFHYFVLEFLRARPLREALEEEGPFDVERAASIAAQVARAIGAAHQEGIVHRALSPNNVLLLENATHGDYVKVRDFGLSKLERSDDEDTGLTTRNTRVGNAEYMAPEYIQTSTFHTKSDIYALGALLEEMITGSPPFTGSMIEVLQAHVEQPPPAPTSRDPDLPNWTDAIVLAMLRKKPEDRPGAYRVVQMLESGVGHPIEAPALYPLDENGDFVVPSGPPKMVIALGVALVVGLILGLIFIGIIVVLAALMVLYGAGILT